MLILWSDRRKKERQRKWGGGGGVQKDRCQSPCFQGKHLWGNSHKVSLTSQVLRCVQLMKPSAQDSASNSALLGDRSPWADKDAMLTSSAAACGLGKPPTPPATALHHLATAEPRFMAPTAVQCYPICMKSKFSSFPMVRGQWV